MRALVEKLQERQRRPKLRQTNFWGIGDDLNDRLVSASARFEVGSKSLLVRVLLEDALDRLEGMHEEASGSWTVEVETGYETARMLVMAEDGAEAVTVLVTWLEGKTPATYSVDSMEPHEGPRVLFMERRPTEMDQGKA